MKKKICILLSVIIILGGIVLFSYGWIYEFALKNPRKNSELLYILEDAYAQLKDYEFDDVVFDCDRNVIILRYWGADEWVEVELDYEGDLQSVARHIKNAKSGFDGILFAVRYTWDGDWYAYYYSENPNTSALKRMKATPITENIYYLFLPVAYVWS